MRVLNDILNKGTAKNKLQSPQAQEQTQQAEQSKEQPNGQVALPDTLGDIKLPEPTVDILPKEEAAPLDFSKAKLAKHKDIPEPAPIKSWLDPVDPITRAEEREKLATKAAEGNQGDEQEEETPERMTFREMAERLYAADAPDPEEEEKERKRAKSRAIIAAIGDGISSLANLHFTNKYAPNIDQHPMLTGKARERWDNWQKAYKDRVEKYNAAMLRAEKADQDVDMQERELARKEAADAAKAAREAEKLERDWNIKCADLKIKFQNAKTKEDAEKFKKELGEKEHERKKAADAARAAAQREANATRRAQAADTAAYHRGRLALERAKINKSGGSGKKGSGSGSGGSGGGKLKSYLSGKYFSIGRAEKLSKQELNAIYQYGVRVGWINTKNQKTVNDAIKKRKGVEEAMLYVIGKMPSWTPQAKQFLIDNYGYTEVNNGKRGGFKHTGKSGKNLNLR